MTGQAQPYGQPDQTAPGDRMIQAYLEQEAMRLEGNFLGEINSVEEWAAKRPSFHQEYLDMLGLWPLPEKTPLKPVITRTVEKDDYAVDMIQFQSKPGLYVTANLFRPAHILSGEKLPAIVYVCGHSHRGRDGNKTAYQGHGIWFARHGYICLVLDTLQLGEIAGLHHGTYREERWSWLSRGYTPAGVECWNGIRAIDYLVSRPDVDPARVGVTGISGGGAATLWIAAADERVKAAVPVSGMADLLSYVPNRVVNGHCDCMFLYNTFQWPWARIAALVAPRPLLFVNSDADPIFPMDANERVINRLERIYSLFGAGDVVDSVVSIGGHAYREDIRQAAYRFLNTYLKNDPSPVNDSERDLVTGNRPENHPITPEQLRVFPQDSDIPEDAMNLNIDQSFVPAAQIKLPKRDAFESWKDQRLRALQTLTFHHFPSRIPPAQPNGTSTAGVITLDTEASISVRARALQAPAAPERVWIFVTSSDVADAPPDWLREFTGSQDAIYICEPRGIGGTHWTRKNPPNYVERSHYLLGRTVDSGRIWDIAAVSRYIQLQHSNQPPVFLAGEGNSAVLAAYAALLEPDIDGLVLVEPDASHESDTAPALLNVLRVSDIPETIGMLAPRPVTLLRAPADLEDRVTALYNVAGAPDHLVVREN